MTEEREQPRRQYSFSDINLENDGFTFELFLRRTFEHVHLEHDTVSSVLDLYCGNGTLTLGSILAFPNAQIHSIDLNNDILVPDASKHPRVMFHQGWLPETLNNKTIPCADIVLMSYAGRLHGFTESNISLLSSHVGRYLLAVGDNCELEIQPWFRKAFTHIWGSPMFDNASIWTVAKNSAS